MLPLCAKRGAVPPRREVRGEEQLHAAGATTASSRSCAAAAAYSSGEDVLAFQVGVVGQQLVDTGASGKLAEYRADGDGVSRMQGRPRIRFGSTVIRSWAIGLGYLALRPLLQLLDQCKAESPPIAAHPGHSRH